MTRHIPFHDKPASTGQCQIMVFGKNYSKGFTLTELTIVLLIIALLLGGLMMPLSAQREVQNINDTQKSLTEIKETLLGFAVINGRLPCPADPSIASGTSGAGVEQERVSNVCPSLAGVLPWATLGVQELDIWGRRITYSVTDLFARSVTTGQAAFNLDSKGQITVRAATGGTTLASTIPAVVISHGANGLGAWLPSGKTMTASNDADEIENTNADASFVSRTPTPSFDDQVTWITPGILFNRMISVGKLP